MTSTTHKKPRKRVGELLLSRGCVTPEQLNKALAEHVSRGVKLGQYLTQKGWCTEEDVADAVCSQLKLHRFRAKDFPLDLNLAQLVPFEQAARLQLVPLLKRAGILWVGTVDPLDLSAHDAIVRELETDVEPVFCLEKEIRVLSKKLYGKEITVEEEYSLSDLAEESELETESEKADDAPYNIGDLQDMAEGAPVIKIANSILLQAYQRKASDLHLSMEHDEVILRFRVDGELRDQPAPPKKYFLPLVSRIKLLSNLDISVSKIPQDGRFSYRVKNAEVSVRTSTIPTIYGEKIVLRLHEQSNHHLKLEDLGMSEPERLMIERGMQKPHGMILATGPTGSGKTTLLYSLLARINNPDINIVTLEDPVESRVDGVTQIQLNTKANMTFASGLRSILRQDPDVIMVGEIRDAETASIAIKSSMTGHKVLSTLHTNDAPGAVARFLDLGIDPFMLSATLQVVVAQRLVRRICPYCMESYEAPLPVARHLLQSSTDATVHLFRGKGCNQCDGTGFKGRMGVFEVLEVDYEVQDMIQKRLPAKDIKQTLAKAGKLRTLAKDAAEKVLFGQTTYEEFVSVAC